MPKATTSGGQKRELGSAIPVAPLTARPVSYHPRWSKLQTVAARLEQLAFRLGPGTQLPRVSDLCVQFGSSITTINAALGDLEGRGILLRRPGVGNFVAKDLHRANVLLICNSNLLSRPELSPFWEMLIQGTHARANTDTLRFDLQFTESDFGRQTESAPVFSETLARRIESGRVDGAVAIGVGAETMALLEQPGFPIVSFAGPATYAVMQDTPDLIRLGVETLAEAGARRIALWSPLELYSPPDAVSYFQNAFREAFKAALAMVGLPFEEALMQQNNPRAMLPGSLTDTSYQKQGYETALSVFAPEGGPHGGAVAPPDAIVSTDDMLTIGALSAFRRCGVEVSRGKVRGVGKRSVLMATHANANSPVLIGYEEDLFLLEMDPADVVDALFTILEALMAGEDTVAKRTYIGGRLRRPGGTPEAP